MHNSKYDVWNEAKLLKTHVSHHWIDSPSLPSTVCLKNAQQPEKQINHSFGLILLGFVENGKSELKSNLGGSQKDLNSRHGYKILDLEGFIKII